MSGASEYDPDEAALLSGTIYTALLAQRDTSLRVPINYVTAPGVGLTAACFSDNHYEDGPAQKCFSNLLAVGFRRFVIDLYWDTSRLSWSLCPVELESGGAVADPSAQISATTSLSSTSTASMTITEVAISTSNIDRRDIAGTATFPDELYTTALGIESRQTGGTSSSNENSESTDSSQSSQQIGPYTCDSTLGLSNLTNVLVNHLHETENSLNATLKYLIFNLHSAAPHDDPTSSAPTPQSSLLPSNGNYVAQIINSSLSAYVYTPLALQADRSDLNASWFTVEYGYRPRIAYLDIETLSDGILTSPDGWPSESYVELHKAMRFLTGFGTVDPQMQGYNFTTDETTIFPSGYLSDQIDVSYSASGAVTNGCLFQPNVTTFSAVNSSWAVTSTTTDATNLEAVLLTTGNLTSCGISPILNATLDVVANDNITLYREYIRRDVWSWAYGEPRNVSSTEDRLHCAALNYTNGGKWQVADCSDSHYGICRIGDEPYEFTITSQRGSYEKMDGACNDYDFIVPSTAMENTYLRGAIEAWLASPDGDDDDSMLFWLNFNDLDMTGCWVDGVNSTCPYVESTASSTRTIVVPVVAAVIIFVLAILTIFIKCASNRQVSKRRRRRGDGGWDYEGVPS